MVASKVMRAALAVSALAAGLTLAGGASAQSTIKKYGARPSYGFELEPHLAIGWIDPPGYGTGEGVGLGGRATFEIIGHGFIPSINNSVGIGVGADWIHYEGDGSGPRGECIAWAPTPAGTNVCTQVAGSGTNDTDYLWLPVVMQWNFWLHRNWSVFGEAGAALRFDDMHDLGFSPLLAWGGGRWHFNDKMSLTARVGLPFFLTPYITFGVSFLL